MSASAPMTPPRISPSATISATAHLGFGTAVWDLTQIRENARIGANCSIGRNVFIDHDVSIGDSCKIQNNALVYWPAQIQDGVFIGPAAILANDRYPRAVNPDLTVKDPEDWEPAGVIVETGASVGAGAIVGPGIRIGAWALVGAGAVVTADVSRHALMVGNPAKRIGWVGRSGKRLDSELVDPETGEQYRISGGELVHE